ncbi:MAG: hypothetical protein PHE47_02920 [Oscillospiraceae bacterium]|nr:hypothetical protein [Oscillospiraceae bacterium]
MSQLELTRGEYGLEGEIRLPAWENWRIDEGKSGIQVDFGGDRVDEGQELTEGYRKTLTDLFASQERIKAAILEGIVAYLAGEEADLLGDGLEDDFDLPGLPRVEEPIDLLGEIQLEEIHLLPVEKDGYCYVGYAFACRWDEDGIGVMTHGSRVVEVGGRDMALLCWLAEDDLGHFS